jgi:DNA polymerase-1
MAIATYPDVKKYMDDAILLARENGYVETIFGRKRYLADVNSQNSVVRGYAERNAINALFRVQQPILSKLQW